MAKCSAIVMQTMVHTHHSLKSNYFIGKFLMNALCVLCSVSTQYSNTKGGKIKNQPVYNLYTCKISVWKMDKNQLNELIIICKPRLFSSLSLTRTYFMRYYDFQESTNKPIIWESRRIKEAQQNYNCTAYTIHAPHRV